MHPTLMLYPLAAMVMLTIAVAFRLGFLRLGAVKARAVDPAYYKAKQGAGEPEECATAERAYANLLESPVLFYVGGLAAMAAGAVTVTVLTIAWAYVTIRVVHAALFLTGNIVLWRFRLFGLSLLLIAALWVAILTAL